MTESDISFAWRILEGKFNPSVSSRWISGCAITFGVANSKGKVLLARGLEGPLKLPLPLLLEHDPLKPCGRVTSVRAVGDQLKFVAEIVNDDAFHLGQVWHDVILTRPSIGISATTPSVRLDGKFDQWRLTELSIVGSPADVRGSIEKVWERLPAVSLREPSITVLRAL